MTASKFTELFSFYDAPLCLSSSDVRLEDILAEKMLYGEVGPGQIVLVDVEGEGPTATFTFSGQKVGELPDLPPGWTGLTVKGIRFHDRTFDLAIRPGNKIVVSNEP